MHPAVLRRNFLQIVRASHSSAGCLFRLDTIDHPTQSVLVTASYCPMGWFLKHSPCASTKFHNAPIFFLFFFSNSRELILCKTKKVRVSSSHFPVDLGGEIGFRSLGFLSQRLGHDRGNQDYSICPITTSFPQVLRNVTLSEWAPAGMYCSADTTPESLLQFQGHKPNE